MAARGSMLKEDITKKILEIFPGSFLYNGGKEIRIPGLEGSDILQIKVTLTCAKTNVDNDEGATQPIITANSPSPQPAKSGFMNEPTMEEKQAVESLCEKLGLIS